MDRFYEKQYMSWHVEQHFQYYQQNASGLKMRDGLRSSQTVKYVEDNSLKEVPVGELFKPEGIYISSKCDSILAKLLYGYSQYSRLHPQDND